LDDTGVFQQYPPIAAIRGINQWICG